MTGRAGSVGSGEDSAPGDASGVASRGGGARRSRELRAFLLRELGEAVVTVEAEGPQGEIAAIAAPVALLPRLLAPALRADLVERARSLGYRYAAVEVRAAAGPDPGVRSGEGAE